MIENIFYTLYDKLIYIGEKVIVLLIRRQAIMANSLNL